MLKKVSKKLLKESMENIDRVVNFKDDDVEVHSDMDIVMTDAYDESIKNVKRVSEIQDELDDKAEKIVLDEPESPMDVENMYTETFSLAENLQDFDLQEARTRVAARDENDSDKYLDYDMFEFVYELLAAGSKGITNIAPKTPTVWRKKVTPVKTRDGKRITKEEWGWYPMKKFMAVGTEDSTYDDETDPGLGVPQISVEGNDIVIYADDIDDLTQARDGLHEYEISCDEPRYKLNKNSHWDYSMKVHVPTYPDGEIMLMVDYLEMIGKEVEDVMPPKNAVTFRKKLNKAAKKAQEMRKTEIYDKFVKKGFLDGTLDLDDLYAEMCQEMAENGIECDDKLRKKFMAEFDEDYEDLE